MKNISELEKAQFLKQIGMILDSGLSLADGLEAIASQVEDKEYKNVLNKAKDNLKNGDTFSSALEKTNAFDSYMVSMLRIGEDSGYLDKVVKQLSSYYYRMHDTRNRIKDALSYPTILVVMMLVVVIVLINNVLPLFKMVLANMGMEVSSLALLMLEIGKNLALIALAIIIILFIVFVWTLISLRGKEYSYITLLQKFFMTKKFANELAVVQFAYGLSLLLSSGISQVDALKKSSELCNDKELKKRIDALIDDINSNKSMSDCIIDSHIFKDIYNRMLVIGLKSGHFEETMNEVALAYESDIDENINKMLDVIEPSLVIILSIIVGIILFSVMLPLGSVLVNL